jgi:hypothetical protein
MVFSFRHVIANTLYCIRLGAKTSIRQYLLASQIEFFCELLTCTLNNAGHILFLFL